MNYKPLTLLMDTLSFMNLKTFSPIQFPFDHESTDLKFRNHINPSTDLSDTIYYMEKNITPGTLLHTQDPYGFSNLILYIPEQFREKPEAFYLIIGPFLLHDYTTEEIMLIMQENQVSMQHFEEINLYYSSTTIVKDLTTLENVILHLASTLFKETYFFKSISYYSEFLKGFSLHDFSEKAEQTKDIIARYDYENKLISAVSKGDYELAREFYQKYYQLHSAKNIVSDDAKQIYFLSSLHTLCRKAVENCGTDLSHIENLYNRTIFFITDENYRKNFNQIAHEILHSYCRLAKYHSMNGYSNTIQNIVTYIDFHFEEDLSLSFLAGYFDINKTYLSTLFKQETGFTITEYIHQLRMYKALSLLNLSSAPITTIAASCGYNDISYFIRIFKRTYGISPKQYQKSIIRTFRND